ncbi:MAG: DUF2141 domain-containing protein [Spirosomaceae bacterium]|jgi:uncharacterized protein (DUF2141 family)|nr:DUF2141 domain-containing protein [Spirosomataceae bacterium]
MKTIIKSIVFTTIFGLINTITFAQNKYNVTVKLDGIRERSGKIYATITNDANAFMNAPGIKNAEVEVSKEGDVILKFEGLLEGKYAISLYQDLNANKQMDFNGQMPAEPFGFSNITMLMGPPSFESCAFDVNENKIIAISLMSF